MYGILESMIEHAERGDKDVVLMLNNTYDKVARKVYSNPLTELDLQYDNCRVACGSFVGIAAHMHDELIRDAKEKFLRIPKPE